MLLSLNRGLYAFCLYQSNYLYSTPTNHSKIRFMWNLEPFGFSIRFSEEKNLCCPLLDFQPYYTLFKLVSDLWSNSLWAVFADLLWLEVLPCWVAISQMPPADIPQLQRASTSVPSALCPMSPSDNTNGIWKMPSHILFFLFFWLSLFFQL